MPRWLEFLERAGVIEIDRSNGRHRNHYRLLLNGAIALAQLELPLNGAKPMAQSNGAKSRTERCHSSGTQTYRTGKKEGGSARPHAPEARATPPAPAPGSAGRQVGEQAGAASSINEEAFAAFWPVFPLHKRKSEHLARRLFAEAVRDGADPSMLVQKAKVHVLEYANREQFIKEPANWLREKKRNDPQPDGLIINNDGSMFVPPTNKPKRSGKISGSQAGAELIRRLGDGYKFDLH